jgi:bacillithiol system protein YtxJ
MALKQFENEFDSSDKVTPYFLDLIAHRDISNEIASRFGVTHQSPQLILIKGKPFIMFRTVILMRKN